MGRKAATITQRKREERAAQDSRMKDAIAHYRKVETDRNAGSLSIRAIALIHKVPHSTLHRLLNGGRSISDFNASKRHLTPAENRVLLSFATDQAKRGFPLSHQKLKDRANGILRLRKGPLFTVGISWVSRWLDIHSSEISVYWSRVLDRSRANGLNPVAVGWYFDTLEELESRGIPPENWYAADETGIALGQAQKTLVIGPAGQKVQHKQQDAEREIVTVMETICANGTHIPPTIIFKGKNLLKKWGNDNACDASLVVFPARIQTHAVTYRNLLGYRCFVNLNRIGVGPNGYMDTELALTWLEDFHEKTKGKNDLPRVLIIDGHASHTSLAFLDRAAELDIHVVSYPPHTTHALQGLDVVIFACLKRHWQAVRDQRERETGLPVRKEDFILLYTAARTATLTPQIIKTAFSKTGAYPVKRSAVTERQMAPSTEESIRTNFPADLASPVKAVLAAHRVPLEGAVPPTAEDGEEEEFWSSKSSNGDISLPFSTNDPALYTPTKRAKTMNFLLSKTSASYLVKRGTALTSDAAIPGPVFERPGGDLEPDWTILRRASHVDHSQLELQLSKAKAFSDVLESCLETSNAQLVLAHLEITKLRTALQETRNKAKAKNNRAKLMSSGAARLLTSVEFRGAVRKDAELAKEKLTAKEIRARKSAIARARKQWRADAVAERKRRRSKQLSDHQKACKSAERAGRKKPRAPKAPARPSTPDDAFFEAMIDGQEEVEIEEVSGDEDEED